MTEIETMAEVIKNTLVVLPSESELIAHGFGMPTQQDEGAYKLRIFDREDYIRKQLATALFKAGYRKEKEVKAETAKWDMLCNRLGNIIANDDDCENNCSQGFLDMVNEIKHYDGEYERQLTALKHRAEVAEEALGKVQATALSILHANSYDVDVLLKRAIKAGVKVDDLLCSPKCNRAKQYEDDLQQAEERLKEAQNVKN